MKSETHKTAIMLPDKFRDQFLFEDIISMQQKMRESGIVDLSRLNFIEPYSMVSFLLAGKNHLKETGEKIHLVNIPVGIHQYLVRMDFFRQPFFLEGEKLNESYYLKRNSFSTRVVEITEIPNKETESIRAIASIISKFRKRAGNILKFWMGDNRVDYFVTLISELCQNIFEHSLDSGYIAIQTYSMHRENILRLVISDSGIGIRKSFENRSDFSSNSTGEIIELCLTTPVSSKRKHGFGLCQVNDIVKMLGGSIFIRSGDASLTALYRQSESGRYIFLKNNLVDFQGTQISITLSSQE